jgi:predicted peptidase
MACLRSDNCAADRGRAAVGRLLLWLGIFCAVGGCAGSRGAGTPGPGQHAQSFRKQVTRTVAYDYLLYLPPEYDPAGERQWPLVVFLHGAGERGDEIEKVKTHGPPKLAAQGEHFPFIIVSPQCPSEQWWEISDLNLLLDDLLARYPVDRDRVYLTGLSMGGFGTWEWAARNPERFAAVAPICGGGRKWWARSLKAVPIWAFHGAKDQLVPLEHSQEMVDAVKLAGGDARLTIYPDAGHDSWSMTYTDPELYQWLLSHQRGRSRLAGRVRPRV